MKAKTLYWIGRWGAIQSWSGSGVILGIATVIHELGLGAVDWGLVTVAAVGVVLVHYASHALNEIMDYEIDAKTNNEGTGRHRILLAGDVTIKELTWLSVGLIAVVTAMAVYVGTKIPGALVFVAIGYWGMFSYNTKQIKLAYKPMNELVVDIPLNMAMDLADRGQERALMGLPREISEIMLTEKAVQAVGTGFDSPSASFGHHAVQ